MKYLKHSLLLLVLSGFLTGEIAAIESSLPPCPTKKGFFIGLFVVIWTLSSFCLVEAAGVEPASASLTSLALHAYPSLLI